MDGARIANAVASLGCHPAEVTSEAGVDILSFGGTKNGAMLAEAAVIFNPSLAEDFAYIHKRAGQLPSKARYVSAQLQALLADGLWIENGRHANAMAARLRDGLISREGVGLLHPVEANELFITLPKAVADAAMGARTCLLRLAKRGRRRLSPRHQLRHHRSGGDAVPERLVIVVLFLLPSLFTGKVALSEAK